MMAADAFGEVPGSGSQEPVARSPSAVAQEDVEAVDKETAEEELADLENKSCDGAVKPGRTGWVHVRSEYCNHE